MKLAGNGNLEKCRGGGDEPDHVVEVVVIPKAEDPRGIRRIDIRQRRQREQQRGEEKERELRPPRSPHGTPRYAAGVPMSTDVKIANDVGRAGHQMNGIRDEVIYAVWNVSASAAMRARRYDVDDQVNYPSGCLNWARKEIAARITDCRNSSH